MKKTNIIILTGCVLVVILFFVIFYPRPPGPLQQETRIQEGVGADIAQNQDNGIDVGLGDVVPGVISMGPDHMRALERLEVAQDDLIAAGVPFMGFSQRWTWSDFAEFAGRYYTEHLYFIVGLREVREEYKRAVRAVVGNIDGVTFEFFRADFSAEQIYDWQDKITDAFFFDDDRAREVPMITTSSSFAAQKIWLHFPDEIRQEYKDAIRVVVGPDAPLVFVRQDLLPIPPEL